MTARVDTDFVARLDQTLGQSEDAIYVAVAAALRRRAASGRVVDVGCGTGRLRPFLAGCASSYAGVDARRYPGFPDECEFAPANLDAERIPLAGESADIVTAVETIEHLENPRAFCRELVRLLRPGGWLVITTPNQRSFLSLGALIVKGHFAAFLDGNYPAHRTALLDTDLGRIAVENALADAVIEFTGSGRMPLTSRRYPRALSSAWPRPFSDHVLLVARKAR